MFIDQCSNGIKLKDFDMKNYNLIHKYLSDNFKHYFQWLAFDHVFFISDERKGRHNTINEIKEFISLNNL
jgi:hypothetical protein